jgi:lambda family phage tail tape measure protein
MSNILGQLIVNLLANTSSFESGMNKAAKQAKASGKEIEGVFNSLGSAAEKLLAPFGQIGSSIASGLGGIGSYARGIMEALGPLGGAAGVAGLALAGIAAVGVAVGAAAIGIAIHASEAAARLGELSQATGVSVESLSLLGDVAQSKGISVDSMAKALEKMNKSAVAAAQAGPKASNAYKDLGVAVTNTDGSMREAQDIFNDLSKKFADMADGPLKTADAIKIFGKAGAEMIPLLNEGGQKLAELEGHYKALGAVVSGPMAKASEDLKENQALISASFTGLENDLVADLVPTINVVAKEFVSFFEDNRTEISAFMEGVAVSGKVVLNLVQILGAALSLIYRIVVTAVDELQIAGGTVSNVASSIAKGDFKGAWSAVSSGAKSAANEAKYNFDVAVGDIKDSIKSIEGVWTAALPDADKPKKQQRGPAAKDVDLSFITKTVEALQRQAEKEETLAGAIGRATEAQIDANAAAEANNAIEKLTDEARSKDIEKTKAFKDALAAAIPLIQAAAEWQATFKAAVSDQGEFDKFTKKITQQIAAMEGEAEAGNRIEQQWAKNNATLKPLSDTLTELGLKYEELRVEYGDQDPRVRDLAQKVASLNQQYKQQTDNVNALNLAYQKSEINKATVASQLQLDELLATTAALLLGGEAYAKIEGQVRKFAETTNASAAAQEAERDRLIASNAEIQKQTAINLASPGTSQQAQNLKIQITYLQQLSAQWKQQGKDITGVQQALAKVNAQYLDLQARTGGFMSGVKAGFADFAATVPTMGQTMEQVTSTAIKGIGDNFASMVATGKAKWGDLINSMEDMLLKSAINNILNSLFKTLGNALSGSGNGFLSSLGSAFGGGHASGGDVTPGKAYMVGERGPELFTPGTSGSITPNNALGGGGGTVVNQNIQISTPDADSFRYSKSQIGSQMARDAQVAHSRLRS